MKAIYIGYIAASIWACLPFIYWITAPDWFRSREGRALMMLLGSSAAVFVLIATSNLFGDYQWRELVRFFVYGSVLASGLRLAILFFQLRFSADWAKKKEASDGQTR
ncbi:hypothetical protein ASF72_10580 [Arthrobacter sp. Leaf141]|uniref:putative phage holin n=1 Tax=Arthrobacter sp. Leaf141 TaxID=1736273 RepID=UPI0006FE8638|nr:hypothetical protein [Arthrobacter sp. Leaf141]KQR02471.1 hypothetical protein ASF72_10580 [Arthrobacter sp. Leaf141]